MKKVLIKLGGSSLQNPATLRELAAALRGFLAKGCDVIVVHGGGPAINRALTARGIAWQFIDGQRQTTPEMMNVIAEVLGCQVNAQIVSALREAGIAAVGLSGAQAGILHCVPADPRLMQVGLIESVNLRPLERIQENGEPPVRVVAPLGLGADGELYNINADWAAARIAVAWKAERLIFLTDRSGILDGAGRTIRTATPASLRKLIAQGVIAGGMFTKVNTMIAALDEGVSQVQVLGADNASQLIHAESAGTTLRKNRIRPTKDEDRWMAKTM